MQIRLVLDRLIPSQFLSKHCQPFSEVPTPDEKNAVILAVADFLSPEM